MPSKFAPSSAEGLIQILTLQRDAIDGYINALRQSGDPETLEGRDALMLSEYLFRGSARDVADWTKTLGWRCPSSNRGVPSMRDYVSKDIYRLIDSPPTHISPALVDLCRKVFKRNQHDD